MFSSYLISQKYEIKDEITAGQSLVFDCLNPDKKNVIIKVMQDEDEIKMI